MGAMMWESLRSLYEPFLSVQLFLSPILCPFKKNDILMEESKEPFQI